MTLSTGDATKIRANPHSFSGPRMLTVNAVPLNIVATAQIAQATFNYPLASLSVDTTSADWLTEAKVGRMVIIGTAPGLADVLYGVIRDTTTSNTLYINPIQAGEPGYARDIQQILADNQYISVVKFRPAWGHMSAIRKGKFFKFHNDAFSPASDRHPNDLINLGRHQQAYVDPDTGLARFTIDVSRFHWSGNSYSSHTWGLDGQTQISASSTQLVIDCEPGCHEITYTLTNNRGKVTTAYRYLFANDDSDYPPLNVQYALGEIDCQQDRQGSTYTLAFQEAIDDTVIFPGQLWLMTEHPQWGSYTPDDLSDPDGVVTHHVGYVAEAQTRTARGERITNITLESPVKLARQVPVEKQVIIEKKTPANWAEVTKTLSNPVGMFYYLSMLHAPYLINGHDFDFGEGLGNSTSAYLLGLRRQIINLDQDVTLGGQLEQLSRFLDGEGNIGSRCDGTTVMVRCPLYFSSSTRNALADQWTYLAGDIEGELERPLRFRAQVGKTFAGAFGFSGQSQSEAWRSMAPGYVRSQAGGEVTMDDTTVTTSAGQTRVNELSGFHHARQNKRSAAFTFRVNGNMDVAEPCDMHHWWALTLDAYYDPFGESWSDARMLTERVTRRWSGPGTVRKEITVEVEPESFGYPGITIPQNPGAGATWVKKPAPNYFDPYQNRPPDLALDLDVMLAWNDILRSGRSFNFATPHTAWAHFRDEVISACLDWHSAYFSVSTDPLGCAVLTYDEDAGALTLYEVPDLMAATPTFNSVEVWASVDSGGGFYEHAHIVVSKEEPDFWLMCYKNSTGVYVDRSTDAGTTWEGVFRVGAEVDDDSFALEALGVAVYDERQIIVAPDGTTDVDGRLNLFVYTASTKAGAFSKISSPTDYFALPHALALTSATNAIVGLYRYDAPAPTDTLEPVTFEDTDAPPEPGYPNYTITGTHGAPDGSSGTNEFAGERQAYADFDSSSGGTGPNSVAVNVTVDLTAFYTFNSVTFDTSATNVPATGKRTVITVTALDYRSAVIKSYSLEIEGSWPDSGGDEYTVTAADLGLTNEQVWYVRVSVDTQWATINSATVATVFLDNIDIDATLVFYDTDRSLYTLNPSTGTYTRRESDQLLPFHAYGIAVGGSNDILCIGRNEDGNQTTLLRSTNAGVSWTPVRAVNGIVGAKFRANMTVNGAFADVAILFGYNRLGVSLDGGVTGYDMLGNWAAKLAYVGRIDGVAGVLI